MKSQTIKQAWEIWILPLIILHAYAAVVIGFSLALEMYVQSDDNAIDVVEKMRIFTLGGPALAAIFYMKSKYEKVKQAKTRKFAERGLFFLLILYVILSVIFFCELVMETTQTKFAGN